MLKLDPRIKEWAYAGLTFNRIFATLSHLLMDKNISYIFIPIVILAILAASDISRYHQLHSIFKH